MVRYQYSPDATVNVNSDMKSLGWPTVTRHRANPAALMSSDNRHFYTWSTLPCFYTNYKLENVPSNTRLHFNLTDFWYKQAIVLLLAAKYWSYQNNVVTSMVSASRNNLGCSLICTVLSSCQRMTFVVKINGILLSLDMYFCSNFTKEGS